MSTKIEWTNETWNPVTGCTPISPGCQNCYARRIARRLAGRYGYPEAPRHFDVTLHLDRLDQPLRWKKPRMIFVCSMGDLFHEDIPAPSAYKVFNTIAKSPQHTYQILTKRPTRMRNFVLSLEDLQFDNFYRLFPNIWIGVTICNAAELWKITTLRDTPVAVRFVSFEPLLKPVDPNLDGIDWVICGAETGPGKRPMELDWARLLRDQCIAAGVPFFFKKDSLGNRELDGRLWEQYPKR
jgi:protein gp37